MQHFLEFIRRLAEKIVELIRYFISMKWIQEDMTILEWEKVIGYLTGMKVTYKGHVDRGVNCEKNEREILQWYNPRTKFKHFTAGNGSGVCTYDSLGESVTVREGFVISKRVFIFKEL